MSAPSPRIPCARCLTAPLALLLLAGCERPPVDPTADPRQFPQNAGSVIQGEVVVEGRTRGNALLFLYDVANPPPPHGRGRPLAFTFVPESQLYGSALGELDQTGPFTAPYAFSRVPPGHYLITGIIDHDECPGSSDKQCHMPDFVPWFSVTDEPNARDVGGAALVDPSANPPVPRLVQVQNASNPVSGVTVSFSDLAAFPYDRPVFSVAPGQDGAFELAAGMKVLSVTATPIDQGGIQEPNPQFIIRYVDDNNDGKPDLDPNGRPMFWPKVLVRKVDERDPLKDEVNGSYKRMDGSSPGGSTDQVVLAAGIVPSMQNLAAISDSSGAPKRVNNAFVATTDTSLTVVIVAKAFDISNPATLPVPLLAPPLGRYALYLVNPTGQTWRLPNELQTNVAPGLKLPAVDSQGFVLLAQ